MDLVVFDLAQFVENFVVVAAGFEPAAVELAVEPAVAELAAVELEIAAAVELAAALAVCAAAVSDLID